MSTISDELSSVSTPATAEQVLVLVTELVPTLRALARETEQLRRMHPANLRALTHAGVFKLTMPADVGGYEADDYIVTEVLTEIARGCPSTGWICAIMLCIASYPALLSDEVADEIYATPNVRITATLAPTGRATPVEHGYRITGEWQWNTGGIDSDWIGLTCLTDTEFGPAPLFCLLPASQVQHQDTWHAAGMAGTATNGLTVTDVFVPASYTMPNQLLRSGSHPAKRRYGNNPYFNRPFIMWSAFLSAPTLLGTARGAMDVFTKVLPTRGPIAHTEWINARAAPLLHHQLARAQFSLEIAEMYMDRMRALLQGIWARETSELERIQTRAWLGQVVAHARDCVNQLFEASSASQVTLDADIQRYFRDANVLHQHGFLQPNTSNELYGRVLAGLEPNTKFY